MENTKLIFVGIDNETELQLYCNQAGHLFIEISIEGMPSNYILFDKLTAIKLSKELKKHISYMEV